MSEEFKQNPKLTAFLEALPHCLDDDFCSPPGLGGGFRVKYIKRGLERGVLAVHWTGLGLTIVQPSKHGVCAHCASRKGTTCTHCACEMCSWFRQTEQLASPRVSRERMVELARRLKTFTFGTRQPVSAPALDDDF